MSPSYKQLPIAKTEKGRQRNEALLFTAIDLFIQKGFAGTSLSDIIKVAGGSRSTIYKSYGNKEGLFRASLQLMIDELYAAYLSEYREGRPYQEELRLFGKIFLSGMLSKRALGCARLVFAESGRFPEIGDWFYKQGAELSYVCFAKVLENTLNLPWETLKKIAAWYVESLKGGTYFRCLCSPNYIPEEKDIEADVETCSQIILAYIDKELSGKKPS